MVLLYFISCTLTDFCPNKNTCIVIINFEFVEMVKSNLEIDTILGKLTNSSIGEDYRRGSTTTRE